MAGVRIGLAAALLSLLCSACLRGVPLSAGEWVQGRSGRYALWPTGLAWRRVPPGTHGSADSDLELESPNRLSWIVAQLSDAAELSADQRLEARRRMIAESSEIIAQRERVEFLSGADLIPVSWAHYWVGGKGTRVGGKGTRVGGEGTRVGGEGTRVGGEGTRGFYAIAVLDLGERRLEVVGFSRDRMREVLANAFVERAVGSLRLLPESATRRPLRSPGGAP